MHQRSDRIIHLYLVISEDRKWPKEDAKAKPTMVCSANDLLGWKDFPKGLKVLLLDEDSNSATEIRLKLEEMDYIVSTFSNENDALKAISGKWENFHVAIVEVSTGNSLGSFKLLETAKDLPIIMISSIHCLSTTMKCIALGAAEFLQKPLSEDKLRNIWQHVVHKAFNAGEGGVSKSLKPVKETVASILQLEKEKNETENQNLIKEENSTNANDEFLNLSSTLHLEKVGSVLDNDCFQDQPNSSIDNDLGEQERTTKFVDISSGISIVAEDIANLDHSSMLGEDSTKNEDLPSCSKTREPQKKDTVMKSKNESVNSKKASTHSSSLGYKANKKKMKVDWTADLHKRFVQAVEQLGVDQAIPSRILELMKVEGLTRHNVASHLQKYRMNRRHVLPKEDHRRPWQHPKDRHSMQRSYQHRPIMAYPPTYHPTNQICSVWGHPTMGLSSTSQMWGQPSFATWQSPENWMWNIYPGMHMDAWGMPPSQPQTHQFPRTHNVSGFQTSLEMVEDSSRMDMTKASFESHPGEEEIDKIVKEAISKPWLPLPLGLKPPSTESVLSELQRQGISDIPPRHHYLQ